MSKIPRKIQKTRFSRSFLKRLSTYLVLTTSLTLGVASQAETLYKTNSGTVGVLDSATTTPTAPAAILQNYAEGTAFTAADIIVFNNLINAANTSLVSATGAVTLAPAGLVLDGNTGAVTINNALTFAQGLTIGASGIDLSRAGANLTLANNTTGTLTLTAGVAQTWAMRTGRTLTLSALPVVLTGNVNIQGAGTVLIGNATAGNAISGAGNLLIDGAQSGGSTVVTLSGNNSTWTGATTVGSASALRTGVTLNIDQAAAGQNKLADGQALTINHATVNLLGTGAGTETVASVALGQGLNAITRTAGTGVLQANAITFGTGAALNVGNIGTVAGSSHLTTDNLNTNLILGSRMVAINGTTDTNWVKNATNAADGAVIAASGTDYTTRATVDSFAANENTLVTATPTAGTGSRATGTLKIAHTTATTAVTVDIGAGNTLTLNDGFNGGGIIRNQNATTQLGNATVGSGSLTAGGVDDSINDTLYFWNSQNTMSVNNVIKDNNTGGGATDALHVFSGGVGTVTFLANNTYTGGTTIGTGSNLNLGNASAAGNAASLGTGAVVNFGLLQISPEAGASKTVANSITGTGAVTVLRANVTFTGTNTYSGITTVGNNTAATNLIAGSATALSGDSVIALGNAGFVTTLDLTGFSASAAAITSAQSTAVVSLGGNTLTLTGSDLANSGTAETLSLAAAQNYQGVISGVGNLIKNGQYTQVFTAGGTVGYTGTTTVNAGTLQTNKALATSGVTVTHTTNAFNRDATFLSNIANSLTPTTAVNLTNARATWQINNGFNQSIGSLSGAADSRVFLQGGAGNIVLTLNDNSGGTFTFNGVINAVAGAGFGSVVKNGNHTWVLGGGNAFAGGLTINEGIVRMAAANPVGVLGDLTPVILANAAGAMLDINGNAGSFGSLAGGGGLGGEVALGATGTLTLGYNNTSTNFAGVLSGGSTGVTTLTKIGTGTQTLSGGNTFAGNVAISNVGGQTGGGLILSSGATVADTATIRNSGWNTSLGVNTSETAGAVTGTANSILALGTGATLTSSYTNGAPVVGTAIMDSDSTAGRVVRLDGSIPNPQVGMLVTGTSIPAGSYIVQVLDSNHVLLNAQPTPTTSNFAPTTNTVSVLSSAMTGAGGFTKEGAGLVILTGNSTHTGATTINAGDVQVGGIWNGQKFSLHDTLSNSSQIVFAATGTQNLNFANSATNLLSYERVGSIGTGGSVTTSINLFAGANAAALAMGGDNSSSTFGGRFLGNNGGTWLVKEGSGTFTWNNPTADVFDGTLVVDAGGFTTTGANGLDSANNLLLQNNGTTFTSSVSAIDTIAILQGGGRGASRVLPNGLVGGLQANYLAGTDATLTITSSRLAASSATSSVFGGNISGVGEFSKEGTGTLDFRGSTSGLTGTLLINGGTLRMGVYGGGAGVGSVTAGGGGTLGASTLLRTVTGTLDINSTTQTVLRLAPSSTGGTIQLVNGTLTFSDQNTNSVGTIFTGNLASVVNINALTPGAILTFTGNSSTFAGTMNVGTNAAIIGGTGVNLGDASRINLNGTGTQYTVSVADTIGSIAGTGNAVLTAGLTLREAASGTAAAAPYSGIMSGAGALTLSNFGGLALSGNNSYSGGTVLSSGSALNLSYGAGSNILPTTGALSLNGGTIRVISSAGAPAIMESVASTNLNAGASFVESLTPEFNSGNAGINLGAITRVAGSALNVGANAAAASNANTNGILGGYATFDGRTWAVTNGAGTAISGLGSFSADTFGAGLHVDITAAGPNAGGLADTLRFSGANGADITGATTIGTGGILVAGSVGANDSTISGALDATGNELIVHQYNKVGNLILSSVAGTDTVITTAGVGRILLTNNVAGAGATNIGYGTLQLGGSAVGGTAAGMVGSGAIRNDGTLAINRSNAQTIGGIISGTGNFEQIGSGTTTLSNANTYQGRTTVRSGTLEITNNAGLGAAATAAPNRWANLTSIETGGNLLINVAAGGIVTEVLNLDGGTLDLRSTVATTLAGPIFLSKDTTINVSNAGAAVSHLITGEILALPDSDLTVSNVGGATPSTLVLTPTAVSGSRWGATTTAANGRLQIGNNTRGWLGTGAVTNNGTLIIAPNDGHYIVGNTITGAGTLSLTKFTTSGNTYLTGELGGFSGTLLVAGSATTNASVVAEIGNDTYNNGFGTGAINLTSSAFAGTSGLASLRTHLNQDVTLANTITLTPATDGTNAKNAQFIRAGLGNLTLSGTVNLGITNAAPGTQRNLIQSEAGGKLFLNAALTNNGNANNILAVTNNGIVVIGGTASQTYNGVLSGNSVWVFNNSGTTTLSGANTVNSANNYIRQGTVTLTGGAASNDDNDWQVLRGATLNIAATETIGALYTQRGSTTNIAAGQTLTVDDALSQLIAGQLTGTATSNLTLGGGNFMAMYNTNTVGGALQLGVTTTNGVIASPNLTNAIGAFSTITLGAAANTGIGGLEHIGSGETFAKNITLAGTSTTGNYISASGTGALILSGNLTATGTNTLRLIGQTGGFFNPIKNQVTGIISEGANVLSIAMPATANDDRNGVTTRWALTNAANDFSGSITVNVGMLEFGGALGAGGVTATTSQMGDLSVARTITLATNNFDGRRYDMFGGGDQLGASAAGQGTNQLAATGTDGTIIFNSTDATTFTVPANITWTQAYSSGTNPGSAHIVNDGLGAVVLQGNFTSGADGNRSWFLEGTNAGTNTISGNITNGTNNAVSVIKEGAGTWRLSGTNTYTGATTIQNGILELAGGAAIADAATVAISADGGDGIFSGVAKLRIINSETFAVLTGDVLTEAEILSGQILTLNGATATMNGTITGDGGLTRTVPGGTATTLTLAAKNTYTGVTTIAAPGAATASATLAVYHLADGGVASGIGDSTSAAGNLVFGSNTALNQGGVLTWNGFTNQSTDRLFTMGDGALAARINAVGTVVSTLTNPTINFSNTGALAYSGTGTRTLTLGGATLSDNQFNPLLANNTGATSLAKADAGLWIVKNALNTYSGGTTITGGTLAIDTSSAGGITGPLGTGLININGGGGVGLQIRGGITVANALTNTAADGGIHVLSGVNFATGAITLTGTIRVATDAGTSLAFTNAISGAGAIRKLGNGVLTLSGLNTQTGLTQVSGGTVRLDYSGNNTSKLADGAGLTLGWTDNGFLNAPGSDGTVAGQVNGIGLTGGIIDLVGGSHTEVVSATTLAAGASYVTRSSGTSTLRLNAITRTAGGITGGTIDFNENGLADTDTTNTNGILGTAATGAYATVAKTGWAVNSTNAADGAINALAALGYNAGGAVETFASGVNTDITTATPTTGAATNTNTIRFNLNQATTLTIGAAFSGSATAGLQASGILVTPTVGAFDTIITGSFLQNAAVTAALDTLIIHQHNSLGALQIDSIIRNNTGAQGLTKVGAGKVYLNAANTYTGALNLHQGEIQVGGTAAAPTTATAATLGGANVAINISEGATLRFLSSAAGPQDLSTIQGGGNIIMDVGNTMPLLLDTDSANYIGNISVLGGTIQIANANALGANRGITTIGAAGTLQINTSVNSPELITYNQGATVTTLAAAAGTLSGRQTLSNSSTAGMTFNIPAAATVGTVGLNVTGVIFGSNGFTKSGNGILQLSANNFADVYDGYTGINRTPTLFGQIQINAGVVYLGADGEQRALGAVGAGNETVVAAGASLDLRNAELNWANDILASREIIKIAGTGFNGTGALRNTAGTGTLTHITLDANATINTGGFANSSQIVVVNFDTNPSNANGLVNSFTSNRPVIAGGGFDLTVQGSRLGTDNLSVFDPVFSTALNSMLIREGSVRINKDVTSPTAGFTGLQAVDFTNGIEIGYGGPTAADLTGAGTASLAPILGARLQLANLYNLHNTVNITMNGTLAATNNGQNFLQVDFFTIPDGTTYLDGNIALIGAADRNFILNDSVGNYSLQEQGNLTVAPATKLVVGGQITGTGGFTKVGQGDVRLTNNNTFSGDLNVLRFGSTGAPWETHTYKINGVDYATNGLSEGWAEWSLTLNGPNGVLSDVANINLQRRGMITLDNTGRLNGTSGVVGANNDNRIANDATINLEHGWLRINGGTVNNSEVLGTVNINSGTNILDLYPTDGAGTNMTVTIGALNRTAGGVLRLQNLDATSTFSTASVGESVNVIVTTLGAPQLGGGGAANTTTRSIVQGVFGGNIPMGLGTDLRLLGFNNGNVTDLWGQQRNLQFAAGSHFVTYEGGQLRPLDDDEYFAPADGILTNAIGANQNVNLSDVFTIVKQDTTINALRMGALTDHDGTGATSLVDHHAIQLMVDGTLTISSGMISSAYFTEGNTSSASTLILGGNLDFNGKEAIINAQNGFYNTTNGTFTGGTFEIRSNITNAAGLTKTGFQQANLHGDNTYAGLTTINDGVLFLGNGRTAAGLGGAGNGIVITGNGNLNSGGGIQVGTPTSREDIYVGVLQGDNQVMRVDNDVTNWFSNVTIDNVDIAGQTLFAPRIRTDNAATSIINGNIFGGNTPITNDIAATDSRRLSFNSTGNSIFIVRGQFGDKSDGSGNAIPVANPVSTLPTSGSVTNENEVLRVNLAGGSIETNFIFDRQYNAAGRLDVEQGLLLVNYDPTALGNDGSGFWTTAAISKIPNADSTTQTFAVNGGTAHQGFILTQGSTQGFGGTVNNNGVAGVLLTRPGQTFNMASWTMSGTGAKYIGGLNQSGNVTYGNGTGSLTFAGATAQLYAADGGTVTFNQRMAGNVGTAPASFGYVKNGRGTIELQSSTLATAADSNFVLAGGTLFLNFAGQNVARTGNGSVRFDGGTLLAQANTAAASTASVATSDAANIVLGFSVGGNEIVARTVNAGGTRNMTIALGNANANATTSNFTRGLGATANFVEDQAAGGTAQITLQFNASTTAAQKNAVIPWATYGTLSRTAIDFAMSDLAAANDVRAFGRAADEFNNSIAAWQTGWDVSENGGAGFSGTLAGPLTISTLRFDANADSLVNLGTNVLTVAGTGLASAGGGILVSSNVGASNKTITGTGAAALTTATGLVELIVHHYGTGNLNINVPITGAGVDLTIAGPSSTNAVTIGTTGAVVLNGLNTYDGRTIINGAVLSIDSASRLSANPGAFVADQLTLNGGTLRYTGAGLTQTSANTGVTFGGNGGTIDVTDGAGELRIFNDIASVAQFRGDLIKVGAGTLSLAGGANTNNELFLGLIDVRQGTLRLNGLSTGAAGTSTILGSSVSYADGTIFRSGTNLAIQMGNGNDTGDWNFDEWITFEGNNYVSVGTVNTQTVNVSTTPGFADPNNERPVNLNGVITISGATTFDVVPSQTLRLNNGNSGYTTGSGDLIKDGQGTMVLSTNNPDFMGNLIVKQGRLFATGQADVAGTGYMTGKTITLGDANRQGTAEYVLSSDNIQNQTVELNHAINLVYNPTQTKRLTFETFANGMRIDVNGTITLNDNLNIRINDAAETGGSQNYVNINGVLRDGTITSGNLVITSDDGDGGANDNTNGRPYNYLVLKGANSTGVDAWTGDVRVSTNTSYDQDQTAILRLEHANALGAANDVDMGFNSMLQVGGGPRTIGALSTNGGAGPFIGDSAGGTMGASTNGTSVVIENAATTAGTLTITQSTPASTEVQWNAFFRDGKLNSEFFAPGVGPTASAALNIVKAGNGWATIATDNAYTGTTTVTAGNLQVGFNGVGDTGAENAAGISVGLNGTLSGSGIVQGGGSVDGNVRPGDQGGSVQGTLTFNGATTLGASAEITLQVQRATLTDMEALVPEDSGYAAYMAALPAKYASSLNDPVLPTQHDKINVIGTLALTSGAKFTIENNGYTPTIGDIFNVADFAGTMTLNTGAQFRTGNEIGTDLNLFALGNGFYWDTSLFASEGMLVVVPEPNALAMLAGSLGLALGLQRFRRRGLTS